jgi:hypothetical protein
MKRSRLNRLLLLVAATAGLGTCNQRAVAGTLGVIRSIPFPYPHSYGSDLAWDGRYLWTSRVISGGPTTFAVDPLDGSVARSFEWAGFGGGITWDGSDLWITNFTIPPVGDDPTDFIRKVSTDGTIISSTRLGDLAAAHTGAAWAGGYLWLTEPKWKAITQFSPSDGSMIGWFSCPGTSPSDLEWVQGSLWISDGSEGVIYQVNSFGNVIEKWPAPIGSPAGIAYDGEHLWVLDNTFEDVRLLHFAIPEPSGATAITSAV